MRPRLSHRIGDALAPQLNRRWALATGEGTADLLVNSAAVVALFLLLASIRNDFVRSLIRTSDNHAVVALHNTLERLHLLLRQQRRKYHFRPPVTACHCRISVL